MLLKCLITLITVSVRDLCPVAQLIAGVYLDLLCSDGLCGYIDPVYIHS